MTAKHNSNDICHFSLVAFRNQCRFHSCSRMCESAEYVLAMIVTPMLNGPNLMKFRRHFRIHFFKENIWISLNISLKCVLKVPIDNIPALVQIMAWSRTGQSYYMNQWCLVYWGIYSSLGLNELMYGRFIRQYLHITVNCCLGSLLCDNVNILVGWLVSFEAFTRPIVSFVHIFARIVHSHWANDAITTMVVI